MTPAAAEHTPPAGRAGSEDAQIRALAARMAQEHDVHVDRAERAIRNLIAKGLIATHPPGAKEEP